MKLKTNFCDRFFNLSPRIVIYDLDGTIVDSSHRIKLLENGSLDLEHWKQNSTKENIFKDDLLPMYAQLVRDYKQGEIVVICTARELGKWDLEYIHSMGIYYDYIVSRPKGISTKDEILKKAQLRHFWNFKQFKKMPKTFADDRQENLDEIQTLGNVSLINAKEWNLNFS